jgi:hypothetical protein
VGQREEMRSRFRRASSASRTSAKAWEAGERGRGRGICCRRRRVYSSCEEEAEEEEEEEEEGREEGLEAWMRSIRTWRRCWRASCPKKRDSAISSCTRQEAT